jgi:hypothetical protein
MYGTPARTRTRTLAAVGLAAAALGSAGAAATYALLDSDGPTTVVRQVTVAGAEPTAGTDAVSVADVYRSADQRPSRPRDPASSTTARDASSRTSTSSTAPTRSR